MIEFDTLVIVLSVVICCTVGTGWYCFSGQTLLRHKLGSLLAFNVRVATVLLTLLFVAVKLGLSGNWLLAASGLVVTGVVMIILIGSINILNGITFLGANDILGWLTIAPILLIQQIILGFPLRHDIFLTPPTESEKTQLDIDLNNQTGIAITSLRPTGSVRVEDVVVNARSADGTLIDLGQTVILGRKRNGVYEVALLTESNQHLPT